MTRRAGIWTAIAVSAAAWLAIGRPWTIRPIDTPRSGSGPFDARAFVSQAWESRALPALRATAAPLATFTAQANGKATPVSFDGVIISVDTRSRVGTAAIDLSPADGRADGVLMIGPVLRGTALRDALPFIQFTDFTNQIEFAAVANALNDQVLATTVKTLTPDTLKGQRVQGLGVAWRDGADTATPPTIVPVQLSFGGPQ